MRLIAGEYQPTIFTTGLWHLNGSSNFDASGNRQNGTDNSVNFGATTGYFREGGKYTGSDSVFSSLPNGSFAWGNKFTISVWFKLQANAENNMIACSNVAINQGVALYYDGAGTLRIDNVGTGGNTFSWTYDTNWHNIIASNNAGSCSIYLDGVLKATAGSFGTLTNPGTAIGLGGFLANGSIRTGHDYNGFLDEVIFEKIAWTPADVLRYYSLASKYFTHRPKISYLFSINTFAKSMTDSILNGASRSASVTRLATFARTMSDSITNGASRSATLVKGLARSMSDSIMNGAGRLASVIKGLAKTLSDSIMNGASRTATISTLASYFRTMSDSVSNGASRFVTLAKGLARNMTDSIMNAASRFATLTRILGATRSPIDNLMNAASRTASISRLVGFSRTMTDAITNGASRFATVAKITAFMRTISDSLMVAKGRLTTMKAYVNGLLIQFKNKYTTQGTSYSSKYNTQGTDYEQKYQ